MVMRFFEEDFNVTLNSKEGYGTAAVEAPVLRGSYSSKT